jgi:ribosome biogenesis GTPase
MTDLLRTYGWDASVEALYAAFTAAHAPGPHEPGRVVSQHKGEYRVIAARGEIGAEPAGRMYFEDAGMPAVGDWVVLLGPLIQAVMPRKSRFSRQAAGNRTEEQIVAANVDTVFLVSGLDRDFNPRRIERYLAVGYESGARPVLVLNKTDATGERLPDLIRAAAEAAPGVAIITASAVRGEGLEAFAPYLLPGSTLAFLGSSGVGKSTLVNRLLGASLFETQPVRESDGRGRHTTSVRQLVPLASGALLLDTPGMRELQLWGGAEGIQQTFEEIEAVASQCRYSDCTHGTEPGCAIARALREGSIAPARFDHYLKLRREAFRQSLRVDRRAAKEEKKKLKRIFAGFDRSRHRW